MPSKIALQTIDVAPDLTDDVREVLVLAADLRRLRGAFPSKRSEPPQNRRRDHPLHCEMETSRVDGVKAPPHDGTPRSYREVLLTFELFFMQL